MVKRGMVNGFISVFDITASADGIKNESVKSIKVFTLYKEKFCKKVGSVLI